MDGKFDTLSSLMEALGCESLPERWNEIYPDVIAEYRKRGCMYTAPSFYDELHEKYGVLDEYLGLYKDAALVISKSEAMSIYLLLLCRALENREKAPVEMSGLCLPKEQKGIPLFAIDMVCALAQASMIPYSSEKMKARGIEQDIIDLALQLPERSIGRATEKFGRPCYEHLSWFQLSIDCKLYRLGRLEIDVERMFVANAAVFRRCDGKVKILSDGETVHSSGRPLGTAGHYDADNSWISHITENDEYWEGNILDEYGNVTSVTEKLYKSEWKKEIKKGDLVIGLHIPAGGGMTPEAVNDTLKRGMEFVNKYYPDVEHKAFYCHSWLLDKQLCDMLGESTNIAKFGNRFHRIAYKTDARAVFDFVFGLPRNNEHDLDELPERTSLEKGLKNLYKSGGRIYETMGVFFFDEQ